MNARPASAPDAAWAIVDRVRDRCYDIFTFDEKQRLHRLVVILKSKGTISPDDFKWLERADENLSVFAPIPIPRIRRGSYRRRVF